MTESPLNRFESLFRILAPSIGGAFLVLFAFDINYKEGNLFTPKVVQIFFLFSLIALIIYILKFREKKLVFITGLLTIFFSLSYTHYRQTHFYVLWVGFFLSLLLLLYAIWYERENIAVFLLFSGSLSGIVFSYANFLFLLKPMNFVILMGMALSFLATKKRYRETKNLSVYNYQYFFVVLPALCFILMKYFKHYVIFYVLMFLFILLGEYLRNAKED